MMRLAQSVAAAILSLGILGCGSSTAGVRLQAPPPPPPPLQVQPRPGYVWVQGHWHEVDKKWVWNEGYWVPSKPGYTWVDGRWVDAGGYWKWQSGHWVAQSDSLDAQQPL